MDWQQIVTQIIEWALGLLGTALLTFATAWISKHIKNETARKYALELTQIVYEAVVVVNQTYVDSLKKGGQWTAETQKTAFQMALTKAMTSLSTDMKKWISDNYGDIEAYLTTLIEVQVKELKK